MHLDFPVISRATDKRELLKEKYQMVTETNKNQQTKTTICRQLLVLKYVVI